MSQSNKVSTLWLRGRLRNIDHVCLASMVANDLDVTLFHYDEISNVPSGVNLADAREILDLSLLDRLQCIKKKENNPHVPIAQFSDFFRIFLQKKDFLESYVKGRKTKTSVSSHKPFPFFCKKILKKSLN